jgi:S1-C subfamily serine protease
MNSNLRPYLALTVLALVLLSCSRLTGLSGDAPAPVVTVVNLEPVVTPIYIPPAVDLISLEDTLVEIYQKVNPGIVALRVLVENGGSRGSGFVIDKEGHIITNYHVVEGVTDLEVAFPSGLKTRAEILGTDLDSDIAIIKVDVPAEELHPLTFSDSDQVQVGQTVIAIGNPFGFNGTMTMGIVSGLGRTMRSLHEAPEGGLFSSGDIIQTDAAINPGNSGGPLLNLNGDVVGVNRAIYTNNFDDVGQPLNSGVGFAISVNIVKRVIPSLIASGGYDYPYVGISSINDLSILEQEALGLTQSKGVYVNKVTPGSPAARAGLRGGDSPTDILGLESGGDLIVAIDGLEVKTFADFISYLLRNKSPGDTVVLTVLRGDERFEITITLDKRPLP